MKSRVWSSGSMADVRTTIKAPMGHPHHTRNTVHIPTYLQLNALRHDFAGALGVLTGHRDRYTLSRN